ncbi:hypothetical protein FH972_023186 [Carpinus fangiana]|uniref:C3H1-type domain-containing protein n=1 Tax=Carpinus fangiana TaxID=176857 RepID=A0A5N6KUG0_9ROSI|nr:hypothetical protein FH972_023186 [Carpinus fangiana]
MDPVQHFEGPSSPPRALHGHTTSMSDIRAQPGNGPMPVPNRPPGIKGGPFSAHTRNASSSAGANGLARSPPNKNTTHVPCKFFRQGNCQAGAACPFDHSMEPEPPCKYFMKACLSNLFADVCQPPGGYNQGSQGPRNQGFYPGHPMDQMQGQGMNAAQQNFAHQFPTQDESYSAQFRARQGDQGLDPAYGSPPGSNFGSPPNESRLAPTSPPLNGLSALDAPFPASFDSTSISLVAQHHKKFGESVPTSFGWGPLSSTSPTTSTANQQAFGNLNSLARGQQESRNQQYGSSPPTQQFAMSPHLGPADTQPRRILHSERRTAPQHISAKGSDSLGSRPTLSGFGSPPDSKVGSPSHNSPSRYGALFARQRKEEHEAPNASPFGHVGSPLRNASFGSKAVESTSPSIGTISRPPRSGDASPYVSSPPRAGGIGLISEQLRKTRIGPNARPEADDASGNLRPLANSFRSISGSSTGSLAGIGRVDRTISSSSVGRERIDEEPPRPPCSSRNEIENMSNIRGYVIKCDESGPPCKACKALDIPCTFKRPTRRRGPPNRLAEAIKRQRVEQQTLSPPPVSSKAPSSPASALSAESIGPLDLVSLLVDDFFTYIHPLQPFPHEPWFRTAFNQRRDASDQQFLALLGAMIGALVAAYPRRPRRHLKHLGYLYLFPNAYTLIGRCQSVISEARGLSYLERSDIGVYDAAIAYFQLSIQASSYDMFRGNLYLGECFNILRCLGSHHEQTSEERKVDFIEQQMARRVWWTVFVTVRSSRTFGFALADLFLPSETPGQPHPPLPLEIDDRFIYPDHVEPQPHGVLSRMAGFNTNCRIYMTYDPLVATELSYGISHVFDWNMQRSVLQSCCDAVKNILQDASGRFAIWSGPPSTSPSDSTNSTNFKREHTPELSILPEGFADEQERRQICYEVQKANVHASMLTSRSYFTEKYWNLIEIQGRVSNENTPQGSPTMNECHSEIRQERESIAEDLLTVLSSIRPVHMEPNAVSFSMKIRQIASTLLPDSSDGIAHTNSRSAYYLQAFLELLSDLDRSGVVRKSAGAEDDDAEEDLRKWADLRECQRKYAEKGGILSDRPGGEVKCAVGADGDESGDGRAGEEVGGQSIEFLRWVWLALPYWKIDPWWEVRFDGLEAFNAIEEYRLQNTKD